MKIRLAVETDAEQIVKILQQGFDKQMLNVMILGCHGIKQYVRQCIATPKSLADTFYVVAEDEGHLIGCTELRLMGETLFWNYMCIMANLRHKGVARELLRQAILLVEHSACNKMSLDVFHDNLVAKAWFDKLGFIYEDSTGWWSIPCSAGADIETGKVSGIAQANVCQREFGFSQFLLNTATASYFVGRLGSEWFKTSQESLLTDSQALAALNRLDPERRILGLFHANTHSKVLEGMKPFCLSARMTVDLACLLRALSE